MFDLDAFLGLGEMKSHLRKAWKAVKPYVPGIVVLAGCAGMVALAKYCPVAVPGGDHRGYRARPAVRDK